MIFVRLEVTTTRSSSAPIAPPGGFPPAPRLREMKAFFRELFYISCMVIAVVSEIAAATIALAIATNKLTDFSQAWMAVAFFAAIGFAAWVAASALKI